MTATVVSGVSVSEGGARIRARACCPDMQEPTRGHRLCEVDPGETGDTNPPAPQGLGGS